MAAGSSITSSGGIASSCVRRIMRPNSARNGPTSTPSPRRSSRSFTKSACSKRPRWHDRLRRRWVTAARACVIPFRPCVTEPAKQERTRRCSGGFSALWPPSRLHQQCHRPSRCHHRHRHASDGGVAAHRPIDLPPGRGSRRLLPLAARMSAGRCSLLSLAGIIHFAFGRYCNYRATKAMGANLVGPVQQGSLC